MSTITKQWLHSQISAIKAVGITDSNTLQAFEIALASLEAEAVGKVVLGEYDDCGCHPDARVVCIAADGQADWENFKDGTRLYAAPPATVSVPDEVLKRLLPDAEKAEFWFEHDGKILFEGVKFNNAVFEACRAAMLQGAELVTTSYKLPDDFDFDRFNDVVWLEAVSSNPHMHSLTTSTIAMVALELNKRLAAGNSPVIPDDVLSAIRKVARIRADFDGFDGDRRGIGDCLDEAEQELIVTINKYASVIAAAPQQEVK